MSFTTEKVTDSTNKASKSANKRGIIPPSRFLILYFNVSLIPIINTFRSSNDFTTLIISFISLFEMNQVNPFSALTAPFPLVFLSDLYLHLKLNCLPGQVNYLFLGE